MRVAIVDYNAGNITSVAFAMERLGYEYQLTNDPKRIATAQKVIFPGVGEASSTMIFLKESGLAEMIPTLTQPVLGICLGMQLMCTHTEENDTECLRIFPHVVKRFRPSNPSLKVPHMGWNTLQLLPNQTFLQEDLNDEFCYFVHSFYVEPGPNTCAVTHYDRAFSSVLQKDNFYATQFHPEKSGTAGETILETFLKLP